MLICASLPCLKSYSLNFIRGGHRSLFDLNSRNPAFWDTAWTRADFLQKLSSLNHIG